jgi:putative glutamine amidotransferase
MMIPIIGVTTSRSQSSTGLPQYSITQAYTSALANADACPCLIPLDLTNAALDALLPRLDGLLFSGGGDVQPETYGSQPHPLVSEVDVNRDRIEIYILKYAVENRLPFLGICRGLQVINIALGGSIYEDILDQHPHAIQHQQSRIQPRNFLAHAIQVDKTSLLRRILGKGSVLVNSLHHQGIKDLAPGMKASASAPDGIIEAIELPSHPFGLAVQWHPEWLQEHESMRSLFREFVRACHKADA